MLRHKQVSELATTTLKLYSKTETQHPELLLTTQISAKRRGNSRQPGRPLMESARP